VTGRPTIEFPKQHKLRRCNYQVHMYWHPEDVKYERAVLRLVGDCRCVDCAVIVEAIGQLVLPGMEV
jgi:hypothetical protein